MTQYIDKSALVAEIEKRRDKHFNSGGSPSSEYCYEDDEILNIIDTLEVKGVDLENGFEEALAKEWKGYNDRGQATIDALEDNTQELAFSKGFYRGWHYKKEKLAEDLKEYMHEVTDDIWQNAQKNNVPLDRVDLDDCFLLGAQWQKEHMMNTVEPDTTATAEETKAFHERKRYEVQKKVQHEYSIQLQEQYDNGYDDGYKEAEKVTYEKVKHQIMKEVERLMYGYNLEADIASCENAEAEKLANIKYQLCKKILERIDSLQEEPASEDLEEAIEKSFIYHDNHGDDFRSDEQLETAYRYGFESGAKWQKKERSNHH
jgi:hypothetical protein